MPFKSYEQLAYLKHNNPRIFAEWVRKYGKSIESNPQRVSALRKTTKKAKNNA